MQHPDANIEQWLIDDDGNLLDEPDFAFNYRLMLRDGTEWRKTLTENADGTFSFNQASKHEPNSIRLLIDGTVIEDFLDASGCFRAQSGPNRTVTFADGTMVSQWMNSDGTLSNRNWENYNFRITHANGAVDQWMLAADGTPMQYDQINVYTRCSRPSPCMPWHYFDTQLNEQVPYMPIFE